MLVIKRTQDEHTRALDAICLAECIWYGDGERLYRNWEHGIYEFRDLCIRLANWTHGGWELVREQCGETEWEFDAEFCPALVNYVLTSTLRTNPYEGEREVVHKFCESLISEDIARKEFEKARRLIKAKIKDREQELEWLRNDLDNLTAEEPK